MDKIKIYVIINPPTNNIIVIIGIHDIFELMVISNLPKIVAVIIIKIIIIGLFILYNNINQKKKENVIKVILTVLLLFSIVSRFFC
jgi:hypothetical protein